MNSQHITLLSRALALGIALFAGLATAEQLPPDTCEKVNQGVVRIFNISETGMGSGSGFLLNEMGDVATNHHVVDENRILLVMHRKGNVVNVRFGTVFADDPQRDIAIIRMSSPMPQLKPVTLALNELNKTQNVWSAGFPGLQDSESFVHMLAEMFDISEAKEAISQFKKLLDLIRANPQQASNPQVIEVYKQLKGQIVGLVMQYFATTQHSVIESKDHMQQTGLDLCDPVLFSGVVAKITKRPWKDGSVPISVISHSATIGHGNSGGPLVNADGNVIGINTQGKNDESTGYVFSSFIGELNSIAKDHNVKVFTSTAPLRNRDGLGWPTKIALILISALAIVGIAVGMQKKGGTETFTQYLRRGGNVSKLRRELLGGSGGGSLPAFDPGRNNQVPVSIPQPPQETTGTYLLQGSTSDGRRISLNFTDREVDDNGGKLVVGRKQELVHLFIDDKSMSRQHATIFRKGHSLYLEDRESANGSRVNGEKLGGDLVAIKLKSGDRVQLGQVNLTFSRLS